MGGEDPCKGSGYADEAGLAEGETKHLKPLAIKPVGVSKAGETPSLTGEFVGKWG